MLELVVTHDFGQYRRGDRISDPTEVATALRENHHFVVKVAAQAAPAKPAK